MTYRLDASRRLYELFGCGPPNIPVKISRKGLRFWEKGALWVDATKCEIQLKGEDAEVLAHEWVHGLRLQMDEPRFEEIFAYLTSNNRWRAFFGPLIRRPRDAWIFLLLALLPMLHPLCILFPLSWIVVKSGYVLYDRWLLKNAMKRIQTALPDEKFPLGILLRMTDREIVKMGRGVP